MPALTTMVNGGECLASSAIARALQRYLRDRMGLRDGREVMMMPRGADDVVAKTPCGRMMIRVLTNNGAAAPPPPGYKLIGRVRLHLRPPTKPPGPSCACQHHAAADERAFRERCVDCVAGRVHAALVDGTIKRLIENEVGARCGHRFAFVDDGLDVLYDRVAGDLGRVAAFPLRQGDRGAGGAPRRVAVPLPPSVDEEEDDEEEDADRVGGGGGGGGGRAEVLEEMHRRLECLRQQMCRQPMML